MSSRILFFLVGILTLTVKVQAQTPPGACVVNDSAFNTQEGGCKDLVSNLVWSGQHGVSSQLNAITFAANLVEGGYDDWRLPTLAELQAAYAHGGTTHLVLACAPCTSGNFYGWSSTLKNPKAGTKPQYYEAWALDWVTGQSITTYGRHSLLYFHCVRQGGGGTPASSHGGGVTHFLDNGRWTALVSLPVHASAPYFTFLVNDSKAVAPNSPLLRVGPDLLPSLMTHAITTGFGTFDPTGHARLVVNIHELGLPDSALRDLTILLVVAEPRAPAPTFYRIRLPR